MKVNIKITGLDCLNKYRDRMLNLKPGFRIVAQVIFRAIDLNFRRQGRPTKWPPLHPITIALRRKAGRGAKILMDTGTMRMQMVQRVDNTSVEQEAMAPYAHVHNQGGVWGSFMTISRRQAKVLVLKGHGGGRKKSSRQTEKIIIPQTVRIPARPFMVLTVRDIRACNRAMKNYIIGGEEGLVVQK